MSEPVLDSELWEFVCPPSKGDVDALLVRMIQQHIAFRERIDSVRQALSEKGFFTIELVDHILDFLGVPENHIRSDPFAEAKEGEYARDWIYDEYYSLDQSEDSIRNFIAQCRKEAKEVFGPGGLASRPK